MNIAIRDYNDFKNTILTKSLQHFSYVKGESYNLIAIDGPLFYLHDLDIDNKTDYETNLLPTANGKVESFYKREPFATKKLENGMQLFRRKHGYKITIPAGESLTYDINVPYNQCKINKLEIIDANALDRIDLLVLDTPTGTLSTVPNLPLNQFGFNVVVSDLLYSDKSDYDADLIKDMKLRVVYHNDGAEEVSVGINVIFHELKA